MQAQITKENVKSKRKFNKKESEEKLKIISKNIVQVDNTERIVKDIQRGDEKYVIYIPILN